MIAGIAGEGLDTHHEGGAWVQGRELTHVDGIEHAGAQSDPVAALITCSPVRAWLSVINGRVVVEDGQLRGVDLPALINEHNAASQRLLQKAGHVA